MKSETGQKILISADLCGIIVLLFTVAFIWYYVEPIKVAVNPFYAVSKIPGAYCTLNGTVVSYFLKPEDLKYNYSKTIQLNISGYP